MWFSLSAFLWLFNSLKCILNLEVTIPKLNNKTKRRSQFQTTVVKQLKELSSIRSTIFEEEQNSLNSESLRTRSRFYIDKWRIEIHSKKFEKVPSNEFPSLNTIIFFCYYSSSLLNRQLLDYQICWQLILLVNERMPEYWK